MKRRNFLVGAGAASIGGSALLGSGAFSRVESDRAVSIAVAEDPDAYLGLDKCDTPNGSYAHLDDNGHLKIFMDEENPTRDETPLGAGINSNSTTWFDRVFQICNQGKEAACVWIDDDENWPEVESGEHEGDRQVEFYLEDNDGMSIIGEENAIMLEVGHCVCIGIRVKSYDLEAGDTALDALDDQITIIADVDGDCFEPDIPPVPFYGTSREDPTGIFSIKADADTGEILEEEVGEIPDDSNDSNYPNGLAFDDANDIWYFAEDNGELKTMNEDGDFGIEEYGVVTPDGEPIAGAAFWDDTGEYLFIPNDTGTLKAADISGGEADIRDVAELEWDGIGLGDLAIDRDEQILYVSTVSSNVGSSFFKVDLLDVDDQQLITDEDDKESWAVGMQIAFDEDGTLWTHDANGGAWRTADVDDGSVSDVVATTQEYTDLARSGDYDG